MKRFWFLFAFLLAAPPAGAEQACTEIGCLDGLTLDVASDHRWPAGKYSFNFRLDGRAVNCTGALPLKPCGEPGIVCDGPGVMITESGCALPAAAHGFGPVMLPGGPQKLQVAVSHNGRLLTEKSLTPQYRESRPNGPQCEPLCRQASAALFAE